jgi:hypothetical protein
LLETGSDPRFVALRRQALTLIREEAQHSSSTILADANA